MAWANFSGIFVLHRAFDTMPVCCMYVCGTHVECIAGYQPESERPHAVDTMQACCMYLVHTLDSSAVPCLQQTLMVFMMYQPLERESLL